MRLWLKIVPVLSCLILCAGTVAAMVTTPKQRLLFEQNGPTDATLMPFSVAIGELTASTRETVFVTPETYAGLFAFVRQVSGALPQSQPSAPSHTVTSFKDFRPGEKFVIAGDDLLAVMSRLRHVFSDRHDAVLGWLLAPEPKAVSHR
jgi:hypothetical protein